MANDSISLERVTNWLASALRRVAEQDLLNLTAFIAATGFVLTMLGMMVAAAFMDFAPNANVSRKPSESLRPTRTPSAHQLLGISEDAYNPTLTSRWLRQALAYNALVALSESKSYQDAFHPRRRVEVQVYDDGDDTAIYNGKNRCVKGRIDYATCWVMLGGFDDPKCFRIIAGQTVFGIIDDAFVLNEEMTTDIKLSGNPFK